MKHNAFFILIDALRHDVVADLDGLKILAPNLARLADKGSTHCVVANAQTTQFVLPSLFSVTYPLDFGGYNNGIRERPASFVEILSQNGYQTHSVTGCSQMGISLSYDRGFDIVHSAIDFRHILDYRISKTLQYEFELVRQGEQSEETAKDSVFRELDVILDAIPKHVANTPESVWPPRLARINAALAQACSAEKKLMRESPEIVLQRLRSMPPKLYWRCLGKTEIKPLERFWWRAVESLNWRFRKLASKLGVPLYLLGHYQVISSDIVPALCKSMREYRTPWFTYTHFMDVHDCGAINRPGQLLYRLRFLPRWLKARRRGLTKRNFLYDSAVMYVDKHLGPLLDMLEASNQNDNMVVLVTGDHGSSFAESPRDKAAQIFGFRTHYEDINVGLILSHKSETGNGLLDSMGVPATLLDLLGVKPHESFKGRSVFGEGRSAVISENVGRGNADVQRRDLFFTVTTKRHKLMLVLKGSKFIFHELYDLEQDPLELENKIDDPALKGTISELVAELVAERKELLVSRGVEIDDLETLRMA